MNIWNRPRRSTPLLALACALVMVACATVEPPISDVEERSRARWDAYLAGDFATVYGYLSPAMRSSVSSVQYQRSLLLKKVRYQSTEVLGSDCSGDVCKVSILLNFVVNQPVPGMAKYEGKQKIEENWVRTDGEWWFVPEK